MVSDQKLRNWDYTTACKLLSTILLISASSGSYRRPYIHRYLAANNKNRQYRTVLQDVDINKAMFNFYPNISSHVDITSLSVSVT